MGRYGDKFQSVMNAKMRMPLFLVACSGSAMIVCFAFISFRWHDANQPWLAIASVGFLSGLIGLIAGAYLVFTRRKQ